GAGTGDGRAPDQGVGPVLGRGGADRGAAGPGPGGTRRAVHPSPERPGVARAVCPFREAPAPGRHARTHGASGGVVDRPPGGSLEPQARRHAGGADAVARLARPDHPGLGLSPRPGTAMNRGPAALAMRRRIRSSSPPRLAPHHRREAIGVPASVPGPQQHPIARPLHSASLGHNPPLQQSDRAPLSTHLWVIVSPKRGGGTRPRANSVTPPPARPTSAAPPEASSAPCSGRRTPWPP